MKIAIACFSIFGLFVLSHAGQTFHSGPAQVALIELYTSEGCSSCPPAEKWLGELRNDAALWAEFVPVAFHVNYWDRLGWRDVFASKPFTDREYAYAAAWNAANVYTPCFVRNGAEWRPRAPDAGDKAKDAGRLTIAREANDTFRVTYTPAAKTRGSLDATLALLGSGLVSKVKAGENSGRELRHEFIALRLETVALTPAADASLSASVRLPPRTDVTAPQLAVAGWVTRHGDLRPIQAAGGWLDQ